MVYEVPICDRCGFVVRRAWMNVHGFDVLCDKCLSDLEDK